MGEGKNDENESETPSNKEEKLNEEKKDEKKVIMPEVAESVGAPVQAEDKTSHVKDTPDEEIMRTMWKEALKTMIKSDEKTKEKVEEKNDENETEAESNKEEKSDEKKKDDGEFPLHILMDTVKKVNDAQKKKNDKMSLEKKQEA